MNETTLPPLFEHQRKAVERYTHASAIPLFFEPGTGKTRTALELAKAKYFLPESDSAHIDTLFIIAPNGIDSQWVRCEIPKWLPDSSWYTVYFVKSGSASKKPIPFSPARLNIVAVNIDVFSTQSAYLRYVDFINAHKAMIVIDEATRIKNPSSKRTQRLLYSFNDVVRVGRTIKESTPKTICRAILTGTPVTNGVMDVWAMFEFLSPFYFGANYFSFQNYYGLWASILVKGRAVKIPMTEKIFNAILSMSAEQAMWKFGVTPDTVAYIRANPVWKGPYRHIDELISRMEDTATFVHITDVIDMPEKMYSTKLIPMNTDQRRAYDSMLSRFIAENNGTVITATTKMTALVRAQQIACGFIPVVEAEDTEEPLETDVTEAVWFDSVPRINQLLTDVESMSFPDEPLMIITHFSAEASYIYDILTEKGYRVALLTGWKKVGDPLSLGKDYDILVANIKCISMGFNLQACHYMIFYSNTYSAEDRVQVEARIWRSGQTKTCFYIDYACEDSVDLSVLQALKTKKDIADYIGSVSMTDALKGKTEMPVF